MSSQKIVFRVHAVRRMFERGISEPDIQEMLSSGEVIETYPDDKPYPSRLILGTMHARPLYVVAAENALANETVIVTVYEPDPQRWSGAFKTRRKTRNASCVGTVKPQWANSP